jgi:hypothetical protein
LPRMAAGSTDTRKQWQLSCCINARRISCV